MSDLSTRVRLRREQLGLSQQELARRMGYRSRSSITKLEKGINDLPQSKVEELAQALSEYIKLFDKLMKGYLGGRLDDHEVEAAYFSHMRNEKIHV